MPVLTRVEFVLPEHGIGVVPVFPDGDVGQAGSRRIRPARKDETTTDYLTGARGTGGETKRLIADRFQNPVDANLGLDDEVAIRHGRDDQPRLRDSTTSGIGEGFGGGGP